MGSPSSCGAVALAALLAACWVPAEEPKAVASSQAEPVGTPVTELDPRIWPMLQTEDGALWFGSNGAGVFRYDGERLVRFDEDDGLVGSQVRDLQQHGNGDVLIATHTGVTRFDGRRLTPVPIEEPEAGDGLVLDPEDTWLVLGSGTRGPGRYDGHRLVAVELTGSPVQEAFGRRHPSASYAPNGVYSIFMDRRGHLWFGTGSVGLCRYDGRTLDWLYEEQLTVTPGGGAFGIRSIHEDQSGRFWLGNTRQWFEVEAEGRVEDGFRRITHEKHPGLPGAMKDPDTNLGYISWMAEAEDGVLWMAVGNQGVWRYDGESLAKHDLAGGAYVAQVLLDDEGRVWASTVEDGVYVFDGAGFAPFVPFESE